MTLIAADTSGQGLDLSNFRVTFSVEKTAAEKPNTAKVQIYNLADNTVSQLTNLSLARLVLQAGYEDNFGVIFDGNIMAVTQSQNGADLVVDIEAGDGDTAYSYAVVNQTLASGYSQSDVANSVSTSMQGRGTREASLGAVDNPTVYPRGRVMYGNARKYARQMAVANNAQWSIQDGRLTFCKVDKPAEGTAFLLSPQSGLIGSPKQDKDGVTAVCCLNPLLRIYDPVQIESRFIKGAYKILTVKHSGDTHASTWTTEIKAVALDGSTGNASTI